MEGVDKSTKQLATLRREIQFALYYCEDFNGARSAGRAGWKGDTKALSQHASRALKKQHVKRIVAQQVEAMARRSSITTDRIYAEAAAIAFSDPKDMYDPVTGELLHPSEMSERARRALSDIEIEEVEKDGVIRTKRKYKRDSKLAALKFLAELKGLTSDRLRLEQERKGVGPAPVAIMLGVGGEGNARKLLGLEEDESDD